MQVFIDSNILIYAQDVDAGDRHEQARALIRDLWKSRKLPAISVQVLQETHVNLIRKGVAIEESARRVSRYLSWRVVENTKDLFCRSLELQQSHRLSFWDAMIVAAAQRSQALELWTEDLNPGQSFDGLTVVNPLR
ncbi:MAG: PIN domain-containing protein [Opitutae bacterium]|nr:PIN domain-containing protein [Opitutae bacterium]MBC9888386.1 PIN domain-containing protein [Opitutae bacterium]